MHNSNKTNQINQYKKKSMTIKELEPKEVWRIFDDITKVARPSKKEENIREYLRSFARQQNLPYREDAKGNIVICKEATLGYEHREGVILQSHMDMVCEKESSSTHNFELDPIETFIDDGWVKAKGTTLGADCGIGMALQLALLASDTIEHPALEALFTVDEEQGLSGAAELGDGMMSYKRMINLDSEDEGEIFIGCAGGINTFATYKLDTQNIDTNRYYIYSVTVSSLKGGHSGDDIDKGRANANKLLARLLWELSSGCGAMVGSIDGGNLRNAIAREAVAVVAIDRERINDAKERFAALGEDIKNEFTTQEPDMQLLLTPSGQSVDVVFESTLQTRLLRALLGVSSGVLEMSMSIEGLVETSTNLASIKCIDGEIVVTTSQRSSVESGKQLAALSVESVFVLSGADVRHSGDYTGWQPNPDSALVRHSAQVYERLFNIKPEVKAVHAGLECGLLLSKKPDLDIVSIGPTIKNAHSPSEQLSIQSVTNYWIYLIELLK